MGYRMLSTRCWVAGSDTPHDNGRFARVELCVDRGAPVRPPLTLCAFVLVVIIGPLKMLVNFRGHLRKPETIRGGF
jgi:hypothetical protein